MSSEVMIVQVSLQELEQMIEIATTRAITKAKVNQRLNKKEAMAYLQVGYKRLNSLINKGILTLGPDSRLDLMQLDNYLSGSSATITA